MLCRSALPADGLLKLLCICCRTNELFTSGALKLKMDFFGLKLLLFLLPPLSKTGGKLLESCGVVIFSYLSTTAVMVLFMRDNAFEFAG